MSIDNAGATRQSLRERDGDNCWLCGNPLDFTLPPEYKLSVTIDHVMPKAAGGRNLLRNLRLAHIQPGSDEDEERRRALKADFARIREAERATWLAAAQVHVGCWWSLSL